MEQHPHFTPEADETTVESKERRKKRRLQLFLGSLQAKRVARREATQSTSKTEQRSNPSTEEMFTPREKREKRFGATILRFIGGQRSTHPEQQPSFAHSFKSATRERGPQVEAKFPQRVQRLGRKILGYVGVVEADVLAATTNEGSGRQQELIDPLEKARINLTAATEVLEDQIESQESPQEHPYNIDTDNREFGQPLRRRFRERTASLLPRVESLSPIERAERRAVQGTKLGAAVVVLAVTTGAALYSRHKWKQRAERAEHNVDELKERTADQAVILEQNQRTLDRLQQEKKRIRQEMSRQQHIKEVVEVATRHTELTQRTTESLQTQQSIATRENIIMEVPAKIQEQAYNNEQSSSVMEQPKKFGQSTERRASFQQKAEILPQISRLPEAPTEQQLSDRVERLDREDDIPHNAITLQHPTQYTKVDTKTDGNYASQLSSSKPTRVMSAAQSKQQAHRRSIGMLAMIVLILAALVIVAILR